eukprot:132283_1
MDFITILWNIIMELFSEIFNGILWIIYPNILDIIIEWFFEIFNEILDGTYPLSPLPLYHFTLAADHVLQNNHQLYCLTVGSIDCQHIGAPEWFHTHSCMIVPDGFIWQIGAMVLFRLIFVIFSKYGCIENAIFGSLIQTIIFIVYLILIRIWRFSVCSLHSV